MAYRVAKSLLVLRDEFDAAYPGRAKGADGTIGDPAHQAEGSASDHNPWLKDSAGVGVVRALDITHDPAHGCDTYAIADRMRQATDPRLANGGYIISNHRITGPQHGWEWAPYSGSDPHTNHMHVSVSKTQLLYDGTSAWAGVQEDTMALTPADTHVAWQGSHEIPDMRDQSKADVTPATALAQVWGDILAAQAALAALKTQLDALPEAIAKAVVAALPSPASVTTSGGDVEVTGTLHLGGGAP